MSKHVILGAGLNSIIAALSLSKLATNEVIMFSDGKPLGAHFSGLDIEGYPFDNGMIYIELATNLSHLKPDNAQPYNPQIRYDWIRFGKKINDFIYENVPLVELETPLSYIKGKYFRDILISNCLDVIPHLYSSKDFVCKNINEFHPKNKTIGSCWDSLSYVEAARVCHGSNLSGLILSTFLKKLCPPDEVDKVLARYHRMLWLPLYYPETIYSATQGMHLNLLKEYKFYTPISGFVGDFVRNLIAKLKARNNVKIISAQLNRVNIKKNYFNALLDKSNEVSIYPESIYSGFQADRFFTLTDTYPFLNKSLKSTGVHICYVLISKKFIKNNFSTLNILESSENALRITNMDSFSSGYDEYARVTIEYPLDFTDIKGGSPPLDEVIKADIYKHIFLANSVEEKSIKILKKTTLNRALVLPTIENLNVYKDARDIMANHFPHVKCFASASHYGVASMNDQIIQGLSV